MTMNTSEVLANTLSPVQHVREEAQQALETLSRDDFPTYLMLLCQELTNEQTAPHVRKAAGIGLKNALSAKDQALRQVNVNHWIGTDVSTRNQIKAAVIRTLGASDTQVGTTSGQVIAAIAAIELERGEWNDLINILLQQITEAQTSTMKQMSLQAIGFICEPPHILENQSNAILNAVAQGANKEEVNPAVRLAAIQALQNSLDFIKNNFERENERNYIMQIVCEATQSENGDIQVAAFECLCKVVSIYYDYMGDYMAKALFGITILGMRHENEQVALQAVEFWSTICELETDIMYGGASDDSICHNFAEKATGNLLEPLLWLLSKKEEDEDQDEWNVSMASATCLSALSVCVSDAVVNPVINFVNQNISSQDWKFRDASVMAFGAILDGPQPETLHPFVNAALPALLNLTRDPSPHVKDSVAWTLGRVCEVMSTFLNPEQLKNLVSVILPGLSEKPRIASNYAWCIINLAEQLGYDDADFENGPLSPYFEQILSTLNSIGEAPMDDSNFRASCYEAIATMISRAPKDCFAITSKFTMLVLERLEQTLALQSQLVGGDDKRLHFEFQANLCSVMTSICRRLSKEILPLGDRIMQVILMIMQNASKISTVLEDAFLVVGALTCAAEADFIRYMDSFVPFLFNALQNYEEHQMCCIAIGLIGDISRALNEAILPYCDTIMGLLIQHIQNNNVHKSVKPACLSCFGDIALAIGGKYEVYLGPVMTTVATVGQSVITFQPDVDDEEIYYSLKEGIVEALVGIIQGLKTGDKAHLLQNQVAFVFSYSEKLALDTRLPDSLTRGIVGLLGDLAEAFPPGSLKPMYSLPWVDHFLRQVKTNRDVSVNTKEIGKWAREMVRRQLA